MQLKEILNEILSNLSDNNKSKEELYQEAINNKLKLAILEYDKDLDLSSYYLIHQSSKKVLKTITRLNKSKAKDKLQEVINNKDKEKKDD